jgi:hypothetical protein
LKKKQQALNRCFEKWGENNARYHFEHLLDAGENTWSKIRRLAMQEPDIQEAVKRLRDAVFWRITHVHPGCSSKFYPVTADLEKARNEKLPAVNHTAIFTAGYAVDGKDWPVPAERGSQFKGLMKTMTVL